jgi:catechol 2,3-dioxygenase-like lactoylglutathione lyase family enzyme
MILNFDCLFYYVSDLERSTAFYRDRLGFKLVSKDLVARFDVGGVRLELVPTSQSERYGGKGNGRLCLRVDHMQAARNDLLRVGVLSTEPVDEGPGPAGVDPRSGWQRDLSLGGEAGSVPTGLFIAAVKGVDADPTPVSPDRCRQMRCFSARAFAPPRPFNDDFALPFQCNQGLNL